MSQNDHYNKNDEFSDLWEMSKNYVPSESAGNDTAWDKLKAQIEVESTKHNTGLSITYRRLLSYAAVLALFALSGYFFFQPTVTTPILSVTENTRSGETRLIELPDGTEVTLASNSELSYEINETSRNIQLSGHASFEVARNENAPFTVNANDIDVTVLGTGFDVDAFPDQEVRVFVKHGKVRVNNLKSEAILTKNQGVIAQTDSIITWNKTSNPLSVENGVMRFNEADLHFVIQSLSNLTGNSFTSPEKAEKLLFTGSIPYGLKSDEIATILSQALNVSITEAKN